MSDVADRIFRDHRRFTGDGLPNEPTGAPLPIGDPQSGRHNPSKAEIRELFENIDEFEGIAVQAALDAQAAAELAEGYVSDAVSQGNVPIYSTRAAIQGLEIPVGITAFRTNGYAAAGDGGAALYVSAAAPGVAGVTDDSTPSRHFRLASWPYNVKMFGATGDGLTDDSAALALAFANSTGQLLVPPGTYKCIATQSIAFAPAGNLSVFAYGATFSWATSATFAGSRVLAQGTISSSILLAANGDVGDATITLATTSGIVAGDLLLISSNDLVPLDDIGGTTTQKIGEFVKVKSVSGVTVSIFGSLNDTYLTADSAIAVRVFPCNNVRIFGLTIVGRGAPGDTSSTNEYGIHAHYAANLAIRDCHIIRCDYNGIRIRQTYRFLVDNCTVEHADRGGTTSSTFIQLGISLVGTTSNGTVRNCMLRGGKHGIAWSSDILLPGVSRNVTIDGNTITGTWNTGIGTDDSNARFTIVNNRIAFCAGGIEIRVKAGIIKGNEIRRMPVAGTVAAGILLRENAGDLLIEGNVIENARYGIRCNDSTLPVLARPVDLVIRGNKIEWCDLYGIELEQNQNDNGITGFVIEGNSIKECGGDHIRIIGVWEDARIANNNVFALTPPSGFGIRLAGTLRARVTGNDFNGMTPIRLEQDDETIPATALNTGIYSNVFGGGFGFISTDGTSSKTNMRHNCSTTDPSISIDGGEITVPAGGGSITVDTEDDTASDNLDTIEGGLDGDIISIRTNASTRDVTLRDGIGNLKLAGNFTLSSTEDRIQLICRTGTEWCELSRSGND